MAIRYTTKELKAQRKRAKEYIAKEKKRRLKLKGIRLAIRNLKEWIDDFNKKEQTTPSERKHSYQVKQKIKNKIKQKEKYMKPTILIKSKNKANDLSRK
ncbi:hypothetical protein AB832_07925 [Flavobacteriaceae bacterium (ex Bugula neritina AB1)]|nr:hypothetical protein AB832_07925 [Flavobacteriaceae bacterium (ex Bugula neritina AB1)]